jgi:hypothetical protein
MSRYRPYRPFERWEPLIIRLAVFCAAALLVVQVLLYQDMPRSYLSRVDRLEGDPVTWQTPLVARAPLIISEGAPVANRFTLLRDNRKVVIRMVQPPAAADVHAVLNGERVGDFGSGEVVVTVYDGDYLEIDAGRLATVGRFVVDVPDGGLASPLHGAIVESGGGMVPIGKVKFKH